MNNKGFTLVELLAVVAILGLLTTLAVVAYSQYIQKAKDRGFDLLAKSAANAAEEYNMDHIGITTISLEDLVKEDYLENKKDPNEKDKECDGSVKITHVINEKGLDTYYYEVTLICNTQSYTYCFPEGTEISPTGHCITE